MGSVSRDEIIRFIEPSIQQFHTRRLQSLAGLTLSKILSRKNPYLFKAKNLSTAGELVRSILDAHLSSQEEGIFGEFLEQLALFICGHVYGGKKSAAEGIDLEFERDGVLHLVTIKSGPHWGNSQQLTRMRDAFRKARSILGTNVKPREVLAVNGCCYGRCTTPNKGDYLKLCGQRFWEFISGDADLYTDIIEPLGHRAKEKNEQFDAEYAKVINKFTSEFSQRYCGADGSILWAELVRFNSSDAKP